MNGFQIAYVALLALTIVSGGAGLIALRREGWNEAARAASIVTMLAAAGVWLWRWAAVDHFPLFGTYENALSLAMSTIIAGVAWDLRRERITAAPATSLFAAVILAQGLGYDAMPYALTISERSLVVDLHAVLAWSAFGVFAVNCALALCVAARRENEPRLSDTLRTTLTLGFLLHTSMIATGSLYKFMLFGKAWSWDPIETMALVAWLAYGTLLHMMLLAGWGGRRIARWCVGTFVVLVLSYRAIIYFPAFTTYHIFDIGLKLHL